MDYIIEEDGIFKDRNRYQEKISKNIEIVSIYENTDTGSIKAKFEFDNLFCDLCFLCR